MSAVEVVVKTWLKGRRSVEVKRELMKEVSDSVAVRKYWGEVSREWDTDQVDFIFSMVVELDVDMRGFQYVSGWMEKWKAANKKCVQKSKPLRKKVRN